MTKYKNESFLLNLILFCFVIALSNRIRINFELLDCYINRIYFHNYYMNGENKMNVYMHVLQLNISYYYLRSLF